MEKERYTIEQFELDEPSCIFDNKTQNIIFTLSGYHYDKLSSLMNLLNQQDTRIKELETCDLDKVINDLYNGLFKENQQLKFENGNLKVKISTQLQNNADNVDFMENQRREIEQLKQSQNQKAIEELKKIKNYFLDTEDWLVDSCAIEEFIINQLKELEAQNEV